MNNHKYKRLINNSIIFAIGNLGSKFIVFLVVPLYTYYLTKSEFGMVDLLTTTLSFLIPIFTLSIFDSVLRFAMDKKYNKQTVLINSLLITVIGFTFSFCLYPVFMEFVSRNETVFYFYTLLFVQSINSTFTQYVRAIGKVRLFAASGIINAVTLLISNIVFLVLFNMGITGYLLSLIFATIISMLFVMLKGRVYKDFSIKRVDIQLTREMLLYSIPLIPNALMWWIMGLSDRYIITFFLGLSANGIYAVANKIPSILTIINSIFFQAWQMSAIEEVNSEDKSNFFSNVFNIFSIVMLMATAILIVILKIVMMFFVSSNYFEAWKYVPFLLLGVVFSSYSGFLGTTYIAMKQTKGVFKTSVIGAVVNIAINIVFVPIIGVNGASIGTMISFALIWILRIKDTNKFIRIRINWRKLSLNLLVIFLQIGVLYLNISIEYLLQIILLSIMSLINIKEIKIVIKKMKTTIFKKKITPSGNNVHY